MSFKNTDYLMIRNSSFFMSFAYWLFFFIFWYHFSQKKIYFGIAVLKVKITILNTNNFKSVAQFLKRRSSSKLTLIYKKEVYSSKIIETNKDKFSLILLILSKWLTVLAYVNLIEAWLPFDTENILESLTQNGGR